MEKYSEKQLLLLSNFVYLPVSVSNDSLKNIVDSFKDDKGEFTLERIEAAGEGGGLSSDEVRMLFDEINSEIESNPPFGELSAARILEENDVRAICYTNTSDEKPVIAFRGTGGTREAWTDNFEGGYETDTRIQSIAADFVDKECAVYSDITVTGHSKGGNMSQYVTVMCPEQIDRCISFDGQGFNKDFIVENEDKIAIASPKIKSISAYNDFVNILLTSIAGTTLYANNGNSVVDAHSSFSLLKSNNYDEEGNFTKGREQSNSMRLLKGITDRIVERLDPKDRIDKEILSRVTGTGIAAAMSKESNTLQSVASTIAGGVTGIFAKKLLDIDTQFDIEIRPKILENYIKCTGAKNCIEKLTNCRDELERLRQETISLADSLAYNMDSKIIVENKMRNIADDILYIMGKTDKIIDVLLAVTEKYEECELKIADMFFVPADTA